MPEAKARVRIDQLLCSAGWQVQNLQAVHIHASQGVAIREFPLNPGHGVADYLLYVNGKACGVIEAKKEGSTLKGVEVQSGRYAQGLPASLPAWRRPLPFLFESTGMDTQFTNGLDPQPRSRRVFAFFRPELLAQWLLAHPVLSRLERAAKATAGQHNLQVSTCRKLQIPVPPLAEQARIVVEVDRHLSILFELEANVDANMQRAQALRQSTLSSAFSPKP